MIIHNVTQGEPEWFELRAGIPTASNGKLLITSTGKASTSINDYSLLLAAEMYAGKPLDGFEGNQYTERGNELEHAARLKYEEITGDWCEQVGFVTDDKGDYGASPDGLVDETGMVELKCLAAKNHVKNMVYYDKHKKAMPDYIPQVQMQMLVCEKEWCDLAFYHPDLPMLIIRQEKIPAVQEMLIKQLAICIELRDKALDVISKI